MNADRVVKMDSEIVRDSAIVFSEMDGETIMMSIAEGEFYGVNSIGSRMWKLLETPKKVSELCGILQPDYDVTSEQCAKDVLLFLNKMAEKGVIKIVS